MLHLCTLLSVTVNIYLPGTDTLAYCEKSKIEVQKSFITSTPEFLDDTLNQGKNEKDTNEASSIRAPYFILLALLTCIYYR